MKTRTSPRIIMIGGDTDLSATKHVEQVTYTPSREDLFIIHKRIDALQAQLEELIKKFNTKEASGT